VIYAALSDVHRPRSAQGNACGAAAILRPIAVRLSKTDKTPSQAWRHSPAANERGLYNQSSPECRKDCNKLLGKSMAISIFT